MVPAGRRGHADLDRFGTALRLTRPLRRARLVDCLDAVAERRRSAAPPVEPTPAAPPAAVTPAGAAARALRVLVADDYFANQRLVTRLLERRGCVVEAVADGQAAVDAVLARPFDVVLMDCNMPVMDGYAATALIRALEQGQRTPILAMTANDSPEDRDTCLQAGMDDYLVKPIQAAIVLAAIERWTAAGRDAGGGRQPALTPGGSR
jgi:CheY-like chemotaxis protein